MSLRFLLRALGRITAAALLLTLSGCGDTRAPAATGPSTRPPQLDALYEQVRASGETRVVVYSSTVDTEFEPLWLEFQKDYPEVRVVYMMVASSLIMSRMAAENATGNHLGDVLMQTVDVLPELKKSGYLVPYVPAASAGLDERLRDPDGYAHYALFKIYGLAYNTRLVDERELPRNIDEALDARWRDRISYVQPLGPVGNTDTAFATLLRNGAITERQLSALRQAGAYTSPESGVSYVAQGRQLLNLWAYLPPLVRQQELGAPVAIRFVPDFSITVPYGLAIAQNAPHPNAARLLEEWLFSPRGQRALAEQSYMLGTMPGAPAPKYFSDIRPDAAALYTPSYPDVLLQELKKQRALLADIFLKPKQS